MKIYPVIHHDHDLLTLQQAAICSNHGVAGVFLISHHGKNDEILKLADAIYELYPNLEVGINLLGWRPWDAMDAAFAGRISIKNLWYDSLGVTGGVASKEAGAISIALNHWRNQPIKASPRRVFAGVDFKYQLKDLNPEASCRKLVEYGFIPTTSGVATGSAPDIEKMQKLAKCCGAAGLALASGVTPENIQDFAPYVEHVLVSTGISKSFTEIDPEKLAALMAKA